MPTRRNRLRSRKTQRQQKQQRQQRRSQRGGGKREIRVDLAYGEYGPEFDKVQIEGIKKYRKLHFKKYKLDHGEQWSDDESSPNPPRIGQAPIGWTCGEPHESTCGKGVTCGSHRYFTAGQRKHKERRCVPTFGLSTLFKEPYEDRHWYEEDNWYLEPAIVGDPEIRAKIIKEFKTLKILNDSFDALSPEKQEQVLKTELERRYGSVYTGEYNHWGKRSEGVSESAGGPAMH